jgi:quercetin dioxygenase-like cupin family protein
MTPRNILIGIEGIALTAFLGVGDAWATPGAGSAGTPLANSALKAFAVVVKKSIAADDEWKIRFSTTNTSTVLFQTITVQPGGHTGWHSHSGPVVVAIKSGTLTIYEVHGEKCHSESYGTGSGFVDPGGDHVHIGRNEGSEPVVLYATYILPQGGASRVDAAKPDACPF